MAAVLLLAGCSGDVRRDYYPDGALKMEVPLKDGRPEGTRGIITPAAACSV